MKCKRQDVTNTMFLGWGEAGESIFTIFAMNSPPSMYVHTQEASIPTEPAAPTNLAAHIIQEIALFKKLRWHKFAEQRRSSSDFMSLGKEDHIA